jgi:hypothetical protein
MKTNIHFQTARLAGAFPLTLAPPGGTQMSH